MKNVKGLRILSEQSKESFFAGVAIGPLRHSAKSNAKRLHGLSRGGVSRAAKQYFSALFFSHHLL
jgi:hypothetical protein